MTSLPRIGQTPMKCMRCAHRCLLDECNCNDPFNDDGRIGCPVPDCGGEMFVDKAREKKKPDISPGLSAL